MRLLYDDAYSETAYMVEIDGIARRPRTRKGLRRLLAKRIL
jgi:hypothetical protein